MTKSLTKSIATRILSTVGLNVHNLSLFETTGRHQWFYRPHVKIPYFSPHFEPPRQVTREDVRLCERLVCAYRASGRAGTSGIWADVAERYHLPLDRAAKAGAESLAALLAGMFREKFMFGISTGALHAPGHNRLSGKLWSVKYLAGLTSLAEYLRVVPVECPEQGTIAGALAEGSDTLVEKIESRLGFSIDAPRVGAPHGAEVAGRLVTSDSSEHIYVALKVAELVSETPYIVEIGAGYGGTAHWLMKLRPRARYAIYDLPTVNILQGYFLSKTLGVESVSLHGEERRRVAVLPCHSLVEHSFDLLVNENSMPEMPAATVEHYLRWASSRTRHFYSYNQEAGTPYGGIPQVRVPEVVERVGGYRRLSRTPSWLRRGYVEEVYELNG